MKTFQIKGVEFGKDRPKICVPIVGKTREDILEDIEDLNRIEHDLLEIRIDHFEDVEDMDKVESLLEDINNIYKKPILFTFRTYEEGGVHNMSMESYYELNNRIIESKLVDLVDLELFTDEDEIVNTIELAKANDIKVIMSNHDFDKTVSKDEIIKRLTKMQELDADISKIALMPKDEEDVLTLLQATLEMKKKYGDRPTITMSMGPLGVISRLSGELFGSCLTFGSLKEVSAPGQIEAEELNRILELLKID